MRALALLLPLLLAGCTFGGGGNGDGDESAEDLYQRDLSGYEGGQGLGFLLQNQGSSPFNVTVRAVDDNGTELARLEVELRPNATEERWWSISQNQFNVTMDYASRTGTGGVRTGDDERRIDLRGCDQVTLVGWRFIQTTETVGSAFTGARCAVAP